MGEREVPVLREHQVEVEIGGELLVELDALGVEGGAFGRAVVRPDDRRVAARRTRADIALLEHGDVGDAVVLGEVVRGREPVGAAADDDDVVVPLQRAGPLEDLLAEEDVLHRRASQRVDSDRAAPERRRAVDRDLPDVLAELLRADDPVAAVALEHVRLDVGDLASGREVVEVRQPPQHRVGLGPGDREDREPAREVDHEPVAELSAHGFGAVAEDRARARAAWRSDTRRPSGSSAGDSPAGRTSSLVRCDRSAIPT